MAEAFDVGDMFADLVVDNSNNDVVDVYLQSTIPLPTVTSIISGSPSYIVTDSGEEITTLGLCWRIQIKRRCPQ